MTSWTDIGRFGHERENGEPMTVDHISVRPGDAGYDAANTTYIGTGSAAVVLQPTSTEEVAASVRHALDAGLEIAVRSGGHHALDHGNSHGGVVIDLSGINFVEVLEGGRVRVGAGSTWAQVAEALAPHRLAITSGDTRSVGVGGLTQGGGMGWMVRRYGLTIDSLLAAEVVTATGVVVRAAEDENPDLLWGLKGGAGNFGVVTAFEFRTAPVGTVHAGFLAFELDDVAGLVRRWAAAMRDAPDELTTALMVIPGFGDLPAGAMVFVCHCGDDPAAVEPLCRIGTLVSDDVTEKPYAEVLDEAHPPPGMRGVVNNVLVDEVTDEVAEAIAALYATGGRVVFLRALGGAFGRVAPGDTAFAHRNAEAMIVSAGFLPADQVTDEAVAAVREPWWRVAAHGVGSYVGFIDSDTPDDVALVFPADTMKRLVEVKRARDPDNVFHRNLNVVP
jgi:FAD/FMN-containing dehydrogenase